MSHCKSFGLAIFAAICLLSGTIGLARAQCNDGCAVEWSGGGPVNLGGLPGATYSIANGVNDSGQAVGSSAGPDFEYAVEWSGGRIVNLGGLPGSVDSVASSINNAGQAVGMSYFATGPQATEWSGGHVINLAGLPESVFSAATDINGSGQAVGRSFVGATQYAVEWSGGGVINLGGLPGGRVQRRRRHQRFRAGRGIERCRRDGVRR